MVVGSSLNLLMESLVGHVIAIKMCSWLHCNPRLMKNRNEEKVEIFALEAGEKDEEEKIF